MLVLNTLITVSVG